MRAVRIHELTGPSALRIDELPTPSVSAGQVRIDVRAAGVNFPDILQTRGQYQFKPAPPFSPGGEVAGVVDGSHDRRGHADRHEGRWRLPDMSE